MTRDEYEERKRRIEAHHRFSQELIDAARLQELRALELVWMTTAEGPFGQILPAMPSEQGSELPASLSVPVQPAIPSLPPKRSLGEMLEEVEVLLPDLPEPFDRNDVCRALGYEADRGTLYRVLERLLEERRIKIVVHGEGRSPSQYQRFEREGAPVGESIREP